MESVANGGGNREEADVMLPPLLNVVNQRTNSQTTQQKSAKLKNDTHFQWHISTAMSGIDVKRAHDALVTSCKTYGRNYSAQCRKSYKKDWPEMYEKKSEEEMCILDTLIEIFFKIPDDHLANLSWMLVDRQTGNSENRGACIFANYNYKLAQDRRNERQKFTFFVHSTEWNLPNILRIIKKHETTECGLKNVKRLNRCAESYENLYCINPDHFEFIQTMPQTIQLNQQQLLERQPATTTETTTSCCWPQLQSFFHQEQQQYMASASNNGTTKMCYKHGLAVAQQKHQNLYPSAPSMQATNSATNQQQQHVVNCCEHVAKKQPRTQSVQQIHQQQGQGGQQASNNSFVSAFDYLCQQMKQQLQIRHAQVDEWLQDTHHQERTKLERAQQLQRTLFAFFQQQEKELLRQWLKQQSPMSSSSLSSSSAAWPTIEQRYPESTVVCYQIGKYCEDRTRDKKRWALQDGCQCPVCLVNGTEQSTPSQENGGNELLMWFDLNLFVCTLRAQMALDEQSMKHLFKFFLGIKKPKMASRPYKRGCKCGFGHQNNFNPMNTIDVLHSISNYSVQMDFLPPLEKINGICPAGRVISYELLKNYIFKSYMHVYQSPAELRGDYSGCGLDVNCYPYANTHTLCHLMMPAGLMRLEDIQNWKSIFTSQCRAGCLQCAGEFLVYLKLSPMFMEVEKPDPIKEYFIYCDSKNKTGRTTYYGFPRGPVTIGTCSFPDFPVRRYFAVLPEYESCLQVFLANGNNHQQQQQQYQQRLPYSQQQGCQQQQNVDIGVGTSFFSGDNAGPSSSEDYDHC